MRFGPADRRVDHGAAAQRGGAARVGLVDRLRRVDSAHVGVLFEVFRRVWLAREPVAVADEEVLQVRARVGVERVQDLVELDRIGRLRDRQRRAGGQRRRRRAARLQVHEPVAFEEDARADLGRRVGVDRQAARFDFHAHDARVAVAFDRRDLADVDAGDAHGRLAFDVDGRGEDRVQAVAVFERDVLGEAEVQRDRQQYEQHHREAHRVGPPQLGDGDLVVAPPPAQPAHLRFPFLARFFFAFGVFVVRPRSASVAAGYFSP